jgi:hypothetical protein
MSAGSFIKAASRLGVSKSIVSRLILHRQQPRAHGRQRVEYPAFACRVLQVRGFGWLLVPRNRQYQLRRRFGHKLGHQVSIGIQNDTLDNILG